MAEIRQLAELGPELDFLAVSGLAGDAGNVRDRASRWMKSGELVGVVPGIYVTAPKRNRDFDTPLGRFSYRHLPPGAYSFGWTREELVDGAGYLVALPEKALLDWLYRSGSVRSASALEARLFEDLRLDRDLFRDLDHKRLAQYALRMPGATFRLHLPRLLGRRHA